MPKRQKRQKPSVSVSEGSSCASPLHPGLSESVAVLKTEYASGSPFPHVVVPELCRPERMQKIREEIQELEATFKETDMFKVYQVRQDLCSVDSHLPELVSLRDALYTQEFRDFVSLVTNCGPLTSKIDCSANFYPQTCHLLCHDDTIGTRKISYIIYLTDEEWEKEDGGALLMYSIVGDHVSSRPSREILPLFNSMCMFEVVPGLSYHSVQEVFSAKTRISIQGWFHAQDEPQNKLGASRLLLQTREAEIIRRESERQGIFAPLTSVTSLREHKTDTTAVTDNNGNTTNSNNQDELNHSTVSSSSNKVSKDGADVLSAADLAELSSCINDSYTKSSHISQIRAHFLTTAQVQLRDFLKPALAEQIERLTEQVDEGDREDEGSPCDYDKCLKPGWASVGPPQLQQYMCLEEKPSSSASFNSTFTTASSSSTTTAATAKAISGSQLAALNNLLRSTARVLRSAAFGRLLQALTGCDCVSVRGAVRRFCPGLGYTCASPRGLTFAPRLDVTLCFVSESELWESGDVGGFQTYLPTAAVEDNAEEAATYEAEDDGDELLQVTPKANTLNLVLHRPGTYKFVKYVSASAPSSRWDLAYEFELR